MRDFDHNYRYHPDSNDLLHLCQKLSSDMPNAYFNHRYRLDNCSQKLCLQLEAWNSDKSKYYARLLKDSDEPQMIIDEFLSKLGQ